MTPKIQLCRQYTRVPCRDLATSHVVYVCRVFIFKDTEPSPFQDSFSVRQQGVTVQIVGSGDTWLVADSRVRDAACAQSCIVYRRGSSAMGVVMGTAIRETTKNISESN